MVHHQFLMRHLLIDPILPHSCAAVIDQPHPFFPTPVAAVLLKHSTALCGLGINSMATMLQLNNVVFYSPSSDFDHFLNNDRFSWQHLPLLSGRTGKTPRSTKTATNITHLLFCFWSNWYHQLHFIWMTGSDINLLLVHLYSSQTEFLENIYTFKSCNRSRMSYHTLRNERKKRIVLHKSDYQCTCHKTHTTHTLHCKCSLPVHTHTQMLPRLRGILQYEEKPFQLNYFKKMHGHGWVVTHTHNSILCKFV